MPEQTGDVNSKKQGEQLKQPQHLMRMIEIGLVTITPVYVSQQCYVPGEL